MAQRMAKFKNVRSQQKIIEVVEIKLLAESKTETVRLHALLR